MRGTCLGGGTELCLASCLRRLVSDRAEMRIGLPEVRLGILPGWGGCTRLPRRIGLRAALDLILTGKSLRGRRALRSALADARAARTPLPRPGARRPSLAEGERRAGPRRAHPGPVCSNAYPPGRRLVLRRAAPQVAGGDARTLPGARCAALEVVGRGASGNRQAGFDAEASAPGRLVTSPSGQAT